jgi:chromosome segregation ATPase
MEWLKSKTTLIGGACLALIGLNGYSLMSMRGRMDQRVASLEKELQTTHNQDNAKLTQLASDFELITKRMGITTQELQQARDFTEQLKKQNEQQAQAAQRLRRDLAAKADSKFVADIRNEAATKLTEVQQDATTKIAGVSGEVQGVRTDLNTTREDLANSKKDLNTLIARNSTELAELRRRGERDYVEFDIRKSKQFEHIADVLVQLKNTDVKRQKFEIVINADDANVTKKDRTANEPVTFLVGRDRLRYEIVVNYVDKDRIRGYMSTPKDKVLSAEAPSFRR